ncbi:MAG: hypothetical protein Kow00121_08500 [Elainellaceae cyanobacterium]
MTYGDRLRKRWVVVRLLPKLQRVDVAWFYNYSDAEGYAATMRQIDPSFAFKVMFDQGQTERQNLRL